MSNPDYQRAYEKTEKGREVRARERRNYYQRGASLALTARYRKPWTQNEIIAIWDASKPDVEIAHSIGRTISAIQLKRAASIPPDGWQKKGTPRR